MRRLVAFVSLVLTMVAIACGGGDDPTAPSASNDPAKAPAVTPPSFDYAEHPDGMWINTDKNDYSPGDRVIFTGGGWQPGDTLNVHLTNDSTHAEQQWTVAIDSGGAFTDSTYLVTEGDLNLAFTLTATSRANSQQTLTVNFTDGTLSLTAPTAPAGTPSFPYATGNVTFTARNATTGSPNGTHTNVRVSIRTAGNLNPSPPMLHQTLAVTASLAENATANAVWDGTNSSGNPLTEGLYGIRVFSTESAEPNNSPLEIVIDRTAPTISTSPAPAVSPNSTTSGPPGVPVTFTVTASDPVVSGVNAGNYRVLSAEYRIDSGGWLSMAAADGNFNNATEGLTATIPAATVATLSTGPHLVCVRATDRAGNRSADALAGNANCATLTINAAAIPTTTTVTSSQNPSSLGDAVTFTATVTSGSSALPVGSGQISFKTGGTTCSNATQVQAPETVDGNGQVTYTPSPNLTLGSHIIRACYGGATGFLASEGSITQVVENTATEITLTSSVNPSKTGQSVVFEATVKNNTTTVTVGTITFKRGGASCTAGSTEVQGPQALTSGEVTYTAAFNASESPITIHACYSGSTTPKFGASEASLVQNVDQAATTTTVQSSANPSVFSEPVTFTVTVSVVAPGVGTPAGTVTLVDGPCVGGTQLGSAGVSGGQATFSNVTTLAVGSHTIRGCYEGNADFAGSSGSVSQTVNRASTTSTIASNANPSVFSQPVTFTVTVASVSPATATPTGSVTIEQGGTACGNGTTVLSTQALASGQATFSTSALDAGQYTVRGCYAETTNFETSTGDVLHTVEKASTTTAISASVNPSILAQPVTFTVTVSSVSPATATPVGNVTLKDGTCAAGTTIGGGAAALTGGQVTFTVSSLSVGIHTVSACYGGASNFEPSDNSLTQQVKYNFEGLFAPVDRPNTMNVSKAGQGVPLKWRLTNYLGAPVLDFNPTALGVAVTGLQCTVSATLDQIEEYAGNSGLQNLGDGYYQFNWKTPPSYANTCKAVGLNLGEGTPRGPLAYFNFKK